MNQPKRNIARLVAVVALATAAVALPAWQAHAGVAYWLLIIVAIHLGLRWPLLMAVARKLFGIRQTSTIRTAILRLIALGIAAQSAGSMLALNLRSRLLFQMSLDWWNFEESVAGFFGHCMAVVGLCMFLTYYTMQWRHSHKRATGTRI